MRIILTILLFCSFSVQGQVLGKFLPSVPVNTNINPVANAGVDITIQLPTSSTTLSGSGTDADGTISTYAWVQTSGPNTATIAAASSASTGVSGLIAGAYVFTLTVTDDDGATNSDNISVVVNPVINIPPISNAGANQTRTLPSDTITLFGSGTDSDGTISSYLWTKVSGPTIYTIVSQSSATTVINNLQAGTYKFALTVTDNSGGTDTDTMDLIVISAPPVNIPPVANAGANQTITLPTSTATLTGSGTDADGTIVSYLWVKLSGPAGGTITSSTSATTGITALQAGVYTFRLTVTDDDSDTGSNTVTVTVNSAANVPPTAAAGSDQTITLPTNTATISGSGSTDSDGTIVSYAWVKVTGSPVAGAITSLSSVSTGLTGLVQGVYNFQLTVTDNSGAQATDIVQITVNADPSPPGADGAFSFTLGSSLKTSAGVFKTDGTLVKTLWSDSTIASGTHTGYWSGVDDYGNTISSPDATYQVKVLSNNVGYAWQGTIGNTSDNQTGDTKHRGYYHCMRGLAFGSTYGYFCTGYSEGSASRAKFLIGTPNQKLNITLGGGGSDNADVNYVTTDGTIVYWGAFDSNSGNNSWVFGTNVSNDAETLFSNGTAYTCLFGRTYQRTISFVNAANATVTGLAVQRTGSYLFVARGGINQLQVLNKSTGALVQTLTYAGCKGLSVDASDNLWMITGTTVSKYTVNVNGTLTAATLVLSGLVAPSSTSVNGAIVAVTDAGASQQVKFFNNTTGASTSTLGTAGGYSTDATVSNSKFYFSDINSFGNFSYNKIPFVAFQSDGSFWVNDPGNFRVQHYNSSSTFIDRIMSLGSTYSVFVDRNNINKVFSEMLEFEIDYATQTLSGTTGWTLKKNWGHNIAFPTYDGSPKFQTTLSNGRTYGTIRKGFTTEIVEFPSSGQLRFTGVIFNGLTRILCSDGSLQDYTEAGTQGTLRRYPLTGFDGSGNPTWGASTILAVGTKSTTTGSPVEFPNNQLFSTDKVVWFNYKLYSNQSVVPSTIHTGYHLGIMDRGASNVFKAQTEKSTHRNYQGDYPAAGWFDCGNLVNDFAGGNVNIIDRNIITSYHGEFWKNSQTNKYNHYYDNGLAVGQFGTTRPQISGHAAAQMAGNANTPIFAKDGNGNLYLYHGDESDHAAIHRWKVTNLNTIAEQVVTIPFPASYVAPTLGYTDLMAGLPFDVTLPASSVGWTRNPTTDNIFNPFTQLWDVKTARHSYDRERNIDLYMRFAQPTAQTYNVSRDLGTNNVSNDWKITGTVKFSVEGGDVNGKANNAYIEVLDNAGKVLTTFRAEADNSAFPTVTYRIRGNGLIVQSTTSSSLVNTQNTFEMIAVAGAITFKYGATTSSSTTISDGTGDWTKPKTLRIRFNSITGQPNAPIYMFIKDLKLYKDIL